MGDAYTIQISSKLIHQLTHDEEKVKRKVKRPKPKISQEKTESKSQPEIPPVPRQIDPPAIWPLQTPIFMPPPPPPAITPPPQELPEVESIRSVLQESERVLEKLDKEEISMAQELTRRAKELHEKEFKLPYQNPIPCATERSKCSDCYKENPDAPLKCAEAVKRFSDCVRLARQNTKSAAHERQDN